MLEWYVAKIKQHNESRVETFLRQYGVEVYAPQFVVFKRGKQYTEPLFPGYVLVRSDPNSGVWPIVRWARGLRYFIPASSRPTAISDSIVEEIRDRVERWNGGCWAEAFRPGDRVLVEDGPLKTLDAIFQRYLPGERRCEILISLIGHLQTVQVNVAGLHSFTLGIRFAGV